MGRRHPRLFDFTSRQVEVFRAVMRAGGVSQAARTMHMSQPAVSHQLAAFVKATGLNLFVLQRGRLIATPEGKALHAEVERHYVGLDKLSRKVASLRAHEHGTVHVGCLPVLGLSFMPLVVQKFRALYPNITVSLQTLDSNAVKDMVSSGELDIGFTNNEIDTEGVSVSEFARLGSVAVLPRHHRLAVKRVLALKELESEQFVALNREDPARQRQDALLARQGVRVNVVVETSYALTVTSLVNAGAGMAIVNPVCAVDYRERNVVFIPIEPTIYSHYLLLFSPTLPPSEVTRELARLARLGIDNVLEPGARKHKTVTR